MYQKLRMGSGKGELCHHGQKSGKGEPTGKARGKSGKKVQRFFLTVPVEPSSTGYDGPSYSPTFSSSKQAKALRMTSSGSVPLSFSPNNVKNMVKLIGPGAMFIMSSR